MSVSHSLPVQGQPFSDTQKAKLIEEFTRQGCLLIPGILTREEVAALREAIDRVFASEEAQREEYDYGPFIRVKLFEFDRLFRDMLVREPIIGLMEALLGADCHLLANNIVRNQPGQAIDFWHIDDFLWFPLPQEIGQFDPRMKFPTFLLNVQMPLTDIEAVAFGPTQFVPGSHYSGRHPPKDDPWPSWNGNMPQSILCRAGDIYLQHPQVWHRGGPNTSTRTRYLLQQAYSRRFVAQRFYPFIHYRMPEHVLAGADARLRRVLGEHGKGAYG